MNRRPMHWILRDDHTPVPVDDVGAWVKFMERFELRRVAKDVIEQPEHDPVEVSTVFLGLNQNWSDRGPPLLFESMVFGGPLCGEQYRYATWNEAAAGHRMLVDEAVIEGKLSAWEVRERLQAIRDKTGAV